MALISKGFRKAFGALSLTAGLVALSGCDKEDYEGFTEIGEGVYISLYQSAKDRQLTADTILRTLEVSMIDQTKAQGAQFLTIRFECPSGKYYVAQGFDYANRNMAGDHAPVKAESATAMRVAEAGSAVDQVIKYAQASDDYCLK